MIGPNDFIQDIDLSNSENFVLDEYDKNINYYEKFNPTFCLENFSTFQYTNKEIEKINFNNENNVSNNFEIEQNVFEEINIISDEKDLIENKIHKEINEITKKQKKKHKIFEITKKKKIKHTKDSKDNIRKKIKVHLSQFIITIINDCIFFESNNRIIQIKKLSQKINSNITIKDNKQLLNLKVKDILKIYEISSKFSSYEEKTNLSNVLKLENNIEKYPKTNELLNMTYIEIGKMFINGEKDYLKMKYGLNEAKIFSDILQNKNNDYTYKYKLKDVAENYFNFFIYENARNRIKEENDINN